MWLYKIIFASWLKRDVRGFSSPAAAHRWAHENGYGDSKYSVRKYKVS